MSNYSINKTCADVTTPPQYPRGEDAVSQKLPHPENHTTTGSPALTAARTLGSLTGLVDQVHDLASQQIQQHFQQISDGFQGKRWPVWERWHLKCCCHWCAKTGVCICMTLCQHFDLIIIVCEQQIYLITS